MRRVRRSGFTLVELITALLIVSILGAVGVDSFLQVVATHNE
ncbi:type II secretion system protein [bacterium]|nr:type II secretion system protein [bacterium]